LGEFLGCSSFQQPQGYHCHCLYLDEFCIFLKKYLGLRRKVPGDVLAKMVPAPASAFSAIQEEI